MSEDSGFGSFFSQKPHFIIAILNLTMKKNMIDPSQKPTILLIEDDLATRELYERALGQNYHVLATMLRDDILDIACQPFICLVVFGLDAPKQKNWHVLEQIQKAVNSRNVPVIAYSSSDDRSQAMNLRLTEYLVQPVLPSLLLLKVSKYIR
jgi:response regulator RpfG family c-di-GMP phosphodiesterase